MIELETALIRGCCDRREGRVADDAIRRAKAARHVAIRADRRSQTYERAELWGRDSVCRARFGTAVRRGSRRQDVVARSEIDAQPIREIEIGLHEWCAQQLASGDELGDRV